MRNKKAKILKRLAYDLCTKDRGGLRRYGNKGSTLRWEEGSWRRVYQQLKKRR